MKETVNVSIAGIAFILDKECYVMLSNYLNQTALSLQSNHSSGTIIADLETRIAEEILSVQSASLPVPMAVIRPILERLGGTVGSGSEQNKADPTQAAAASSPLTKRLYRNPEGAKLGGVCTGLASYFNSSVLLFRLLFLLPLIVNIFSSIWRFNSLFGWHWNHGCYNWDGSFSGTALLIYVILWIVTPQARSPRQKLEMRGESVTVGSLSQTSGSEIVSKGGNSGATNTILTILKVFVLSIFGVTFFSVLGGLIVGFAKIAIEMNNQWTPIPDALNAMGISYFWAAMIVGGITIIPFFIILYLVFCAAVGLRGAKVVSLILGLIWIALLATAMVLVLSNITELSAIDWHKWHSNWDYWHIEFN